MVDIYNAADVFVIPSLEDNLPNTIMEAMACGIDQIPKTKHHTNILTRILQ